jgi:predicted RNA binding protein YcfA (HicA-like mRNA interferase family)
VKTPRDLSGADLVAGLKRVGYEFVRQKGSHVSMVTQVNGEHHVTIPLHNPIKVGTLNGILNAVADHLQMSKEQLLREMKV